MATPNQSPEPSISFDAFFKGMEPKLKWILLKYRIPPDDAEDVLQQTLLALLYQWDRVRDPDSWLSSTLRRHCMMYWRLRKRRIYSAVDAAVLDWLSEPVAPTQERTELLCDLKNMLDRLPSKCRDLLRLRYFGYQPKEMAAKLGYQFSSIGKVTARCLSALARELLSAGLYLGEPEEALRLAERG
jgi:RNA polymerase sigma factor (sigma-70 family)